MLRRFLTSFIALVVAFSLVSSAAAQSYSFSLDREVVDVFWNADGTMSIEYLFTFTNNPGAHVIDFVDVGTPNSSYDGSSISADVDGSPVSISNDYQGTGSGFAVDMGSHAIQPGQSGTLRVSIGRVSGVLAPDDNDENYASGNFAPTYYDGQFVTGSTDLTVTFHLPPGIKAEEPRWHDAPPGFPSEPETGLDAEGRVTYSWRNPDASADQMYVFGASFPRSYVPADSIYIAPVAPPVSIDFGVLFNVLCFGVICLSFFGIPTITALQGQRRKLSYLPPRVAIEGHGIKRGLTAVEAAILMEQPLDKVLTMILFGTIKKEAARVTSREPLQVEVASLLPEGLNEYELDFLKAFKETNHKERQSLFQEMMVKLVRAVSEKMRGFSRKETEEYYKNIMERAWQQVEAADTPEVKGRRMDEGFEWTMLDRDYDDRMQRTFRGPIYVPTWWGHYDPTFHPASTGGGGTVAAPSAPSVPAQGPASLPGADFAASVVKGTQSFSSRVLGDLKTFTSKVTSVTNPPPPPSVGSSTRSGGSGRSGGCACACACACAGCACACAGGGR